MTLEKQKKYKITFQIGKEILNYTCEVVEIDGDLITILDKFNEEYTYNKKLILAYSEVKC